MFKRRVKCNDRSKTAKNGEVDLAPTRYQTAYESGPTTLLSSFFLTIDMDQRSKDTAQWNALPTGSSECNVVLLIY